MTRGQCVCDRSDCKPSPLQHPVGAAPLGAVSAKGRGVLVWLAALSSSVGATLGSLGLRGRETHPWPLGPASWVPVSCLGLWEGPHFHPSSRGSLRGCQCLPGASPKGAEVPGGGAFGPRKPNLTDGAPGLLPDSASDSTSPPTDRRQAAGLSSSSSSWGEVDWASLPLPSWPELHCLSSTDLPSTLWARTAPRPTRGLEEKRPFFCSRA